MTYAPLFGILADARLEEVPFRHEALYVDTTSAATFHYHGEGSLADPGSWSSQARGSTFHERTPRALWLCCLLDGNDEAAFHLWVSKLAADALVPALDASSTAGAALGALLTAFFFHAPLDFDDRDDPMWCDPIWRDARALLQRADDDPTPADVDAWDLAAIRARWRLRVSRRTERKPTLRAVQSLGVPRSMGLEGMLIDQGASGLALGEALDQLDPGRIDGVIVAGGAAEGPLRRLAATKSPMRFLVGGSASAAARFSALELLHVGVLSAGDLRAFAGSSCRLRSLRGSRAPIGADGFDALAEIDAFAELQELYLGGAMARGDAAAWLQSGRTRHLHSLSLPNQTSGDITFGFTSMEAFAHADWSSLRVLELKSNEKLGPHVEAFAANPTLGPLRHLGLEGTCADEERIAALAACPRLSELEHLDLFRTRTGVGLVAIAQSPYLKKLRRLKVTLVDDAAVRAFAEHAAFEGLEELGIERSSLGDSVEALADASWMRSVRVLSLQENQVDDAGCRALAASPHLGALQDLQLYKNALTKAGVEALLAGLPALRNLRVYGVKVSNAERERIRALRPEVEVMI